MATETTVVAALDVLREMVHEESELMEQGGIWLRASSRRTPRRWYVVKTNRRVYRKTFEVLSRLGFLDGPAHDTIYVVSDKGRAALLALP